MLQLNLLKHSAGFTLIEAVVALSIVAAALASIGSLIATSAHGTRSIESRLTRLETARSIMSALPDRDQLVPGTLSGALANHRWQVDVLPYASQNLNPQSTAQWVPQTVIVTIQAPTGAAMKIETIRLQRVKTK